MSVPLSTVSPLTYNEWLSYQDTLIPGTAQRVYTEYLTSWYNQKQAKQQVKSSKEDYIQLVKDLSFLFGKNEKDRFLNEIDYNNDEELVFAIPFFAKKLKEIAKTLSNKRESVKRAKLKYNLVGSSQGLERLLYEYVLKGFTKKEDSTVQVPALVVQSVFPDLTSVKDNFFIEVEELYDPSSYHDSDPSVNINEYVSLSDVENEIPFVDEGDPLTEEEINAILATRFLPKVAETPLSQIFKQYLTSIPTLSTASLSSTAFQDVYNKTAAAQKYLGETVYGLTAVRLSEYNVPDQVLNIGMEPGNNWFLWPSGDRVFDTTLFNDIFSPIYINDSNFVACSATAGTEYSNSDLIFTEKNGTIEGAWLKGTYLLNTSANVSISFKPGLIKEFIFPYVGFNLNSKNLSWGGYTFDQSYIPLFNTLDGSIQRLILEQYYTQSLPISASKPLYINQTNLIDSGAFAAKFSDEADVLTKRLSSNSVLSIYSDSLLGETEQAYAFKFDRTDLPLAQGSNQIYWPIEVFDEVNNIPITIKKDQCLPLGLSYTNPSNTVPGAIAGTDFNSSDVIYRLNNRTSEPVEAAWLGSGSITNLDLFTNSIPVYSTPAIKCAQFIDGPIQGALSIKVDPSDKISFIWMDEDTYADEVIKYYEHSADCAYGKNLPHDYYSNQDYLNPTPINSLDAWKTCTCRSLKYSPIGHAGENLLDYNGVADYLFADPDGLGADFAINSWTDTRGYTPFNSPQFAFYQLQTGGDGDKEIGWGPGKWKTGDGSRMVFKTGRRYTYYRSSLRKDVAKTTEIASPYIVVNYPYKRIKGNCNASGCMDVVLIIDISKSQSLDLQSVKNSLKNITDAILSTGGVSAQISIITFDNEASTITYLSNDPATIDLYISQIQIDSGYPNFRTNIENALILADSILYNQIPTSATVNNFNFFDLCKNLNTTIISQSKAVKILNNPQEGCNKKIVIFSDGAENENIGAALPRAKILTNKGVEINTVDIGLLSVNNTLMEEMASSPSTYFNLQRYLTSGDGDEPTFSQLISRRIAGCGNFAATWYKAVRGVNGDWVSTDDISDMNIYPGDYLIYVHRDGISYISPNNSSSFTQPAISFTANFKLDGWDYTSNTFITSAEGSSFGAKPFWGKVYNSPDTNNEFNKETSSFGGQVRFFDDYVPVHQPEISPLVLTNGDFIQYSRKDYKTLDWNQPVSLEVTLSSNRWKKMVFYKDYSNLADILRTGTLDLIGYGSDEDSDILLESFSQFRPSRYNYFARNAFNYQQNLYYVSRCPSTFVVFNTGAIISPSEPYANLDNKFYPTVATVSYPQLTVSERQLGEYMLPEKLGASSYRGRGYTIEVDGGTLESIDSLSAERIFFDTQKYGPRNRGLTKKDQITPVTITDIDNRWVMEPYSAGIKAGVIIGTQENQKFTPYQSRYEIMGKNIHGLFRQGEADNFQFWNPADPGVWNSPEKYPLTFRNELLSSSYLKRIEKLLINKGVLDHWSSDIFGNDYGLYKTNLYKLSGPCADSTLVSVSACQGLGDNPWYYINGGCVPSIPDGPGGAGDTSITGCAGCATPTSSDPSTVEYYGYASSPTWCECVGSGAICNSTLVTTTDGDKLGYYCILDNEPPAAVQYLIQNNGCIYPGTGCQPPYNFIASKVFINPFNRTSNVTIVGSADDDALLEYTGGNIWLRAGGETATCAAGPINYSITVGPKETFRITGYDIYGYCGGVELTVTFS
jgi:hypothetical protein